MEKKHIDIILILSTIILLILFVIVIFTVILGKDIDPPNIDDLKVVRLELDDDDNAFTYLAQTENISWFDYSSYTINTIVISNMTLAVSIVESNQVTINLIDQALKCKHLQIPEIKGYDTLLPYVSSFRAQARLKALQSRVLFSQGKENEAFEAALDIIRLGEMQKSSGGGIIHYLVAIAIEGIGLNTLEEFIPFTTLSSDTLISYAGILEKNRFGIGLLYILSVKT